MKFFVIVFNVIFLTSCATNTQVGICDLAPLEDGWLNIAKPAVIKNTEKPGDKRYFEWFENNTGELMRCERFKAKPGCFEEGIFFNAKTGEQMVKDDIEALLIVCGS